MAGKVFGREHELARADGFPETAGTEFTYDGGPGREADTTPNTLFVFVP